MASIERYRALFRRSFKCLSKAFQGLLRRFSAEFLGDLLQLGLRELAIHGLARLLREVRDRFVARLPLQRRVQGAHLLQDLLGLEI